MSDDLRAASVLWALHPAVHHAMTMRSALEGALPEALRRLSAGVALPASAKPTDPVRNGTTLVLPIYGVLAPRGMLRGGTAYEAIADRVREAVDDKRVGAIVLDVRSPGGTVWGCEEAGDAIYAARQSKPIIAVASPFSFSAAYWLSSQAGAFFATPSGEVGSVGVRAGHVDRSGFEGKIGMRTTLVASSSDKTAGHPHAPLSDADRAEIQAGVDEANARFTAALARGRGIRPADVARVHGTGRTFSARRAAHRGAVDGVATLRDVVARYGSSAGRLALLRRQTAARAAVVNL